MCSLCSLKNLGQKPWISIFLQIDYFFIHQVLCDEWLELIREQRKANQAGTVFFFVQLCVQLFLQRNFETAKYLSLMKDLAFCLEKIKHEDKMESKSLLNAIKGIDIKDKVIYL